MQLERHLSLKARWALPIGALAVLGCDPTATEIVVVVDTVLDAEAGEYDRVEVEVSAGGTSERRCAVIGHDEEGCVRVLPGSRVGGGGFPLALSVLSASGRGQLLARAQLSREGSVVACRALSVELEPSEEPRGLRLDVGRPCGAPDCSTAEVTSTEPWAGLPPALGPQPPPSEPPMLPIRRIAAGAQHACLIDGMNRLFCWGENDQYQLGTRDSFDRFRPSLVLGLSDLVDVDAGETHTCAVTSGGEVHCWGGNDDGQVGNRSRDAIVQRPFLALTGATAVSVGPSHSCAIVADGVQCWGSNAHGESGGDDNPRLDPGLVPGLPASIAHLSAGGGSGATAARHTCAIDDTGAAHCWGNNSSRQLGFEGDSARTAMPVDPTEMLIDIAAGSNETCAIATGGQVFCWGRNIPPGTLGFMGAEALEQRPPSRIDADTNATRIAAGDTWRCFVAEQRVYCFGNELSYRMGQSPMEDETTTFVDPVLVPTPAIPFAEVAVGGLFACALPADGTMPWCWGDNLVGQLAQGTPGEPSPPVQIPLCN